MNGFITLNSLNYLTNLAITFDHHHLGVCLNTKCYCNFYFVFSLGFMSRTHLLEMNELVLIIENKKNVWFKSIAFVFYIFFFCCDYGNLEISLHHLTLLNDWILLILLTSDHLMFTVHLKYHSRAVFFFVMFNLLLLLLLLIRCASQKNFLMELLVIFNSFILLF